MKTTDDRLPLELDERRKNPEPIILVWDWFVRIGHWTLVLAFAVNYLFYRKFPSHAYAGYLIFLIVLARIVWGFTGSRAARFSSFSFTPRQSWEYFLDAWRGHAAYYVSHNPLGAWMVFALLGLLLSNGFNGLLLYSAGQQLGPFGAAVPSAWEDPLIVIHTLLGHFTALCVGLHVLGVLWAARAHRENYVVAMFTGYKRVPRRADQSSIEGYPRYTEQNIPQRLRPLERWLNRRHTFWGSLLVVFLVCALAYGLARHLVGFNKFLVAY